MTSWSLLPMTNFLKDSWSQHHKWSFFNLAETITDYSVKFRQKNPALRQASFLGIVFLVISKTPFLLSRTFAISVIFTLPKNGVFYGFSYMVFETMLFSVYEYSQMTSEGIVETRRKGNMLRFLIKLFTRGYISNYVLLEDRLIKYDGKKVDLSIRWAI